MDFKRHAFIALTFILLSSAIFSSIILIDQVNQRKLHQVQLAEFMHVRYGLLNPHEWKRKVSEILTQSLDDLDLETMDKTEIREQIIVALERLFQELDKLLNERKQKGFWLERAIRSTIMDFTIDMEEIKKEIPQLADAILEELDTPEARANLKLFVQEKINGLVEKSIGAEDNADIRKLMANIACDDEGDCKIMLTTRIDELGHNITKQSLIVIFSVLLIFAFWFILKDDTFRNWQWYFLSISVIILLFLGLTTPMINIDARIDEVKISFLDQELKFEDQILFFQSKSILDVVTILLRNGDFQTIMVGVLILLFSIVFPLLKLISLLWLRVRKTVKDQKIVNFLAYRTGKWSMADVFVVAIFMAYIGFRGILDSQLNQISSSSEKAEIIATDQSSLQVGILFFSAFVILSMVLSQVSKVSKGNSTV